MENQFADPETDARVGMVDALVNLHGAFVD